MSTSTTAPSRSRSASRTRSHSSEHIFHHISRHTRKQLKFVLPGGIVTYLFGTLARLWQLIEEESGLAQLSAQTSLVCGVLTVGLFLYLLLMPWIKGSQPNYSQWRKSGDLQVVVPVLTVLMVIGWLLLCVILSHWTDLGHLKGVMAASGLYALVFGLLGLIPAPRLHRN